MSDVATEHTGISLLRIWTGCVTSCAGKCVDVLKISEFFFSPKQKKILKNCGCFCSYVWQHLDTGYVQGMCDLLAPLLVILDDGQLHLSFLTSLLLEIFSFTGRLCKDFSPVAARFKAAFFYFSHLLLTLS